MPSTFYLLRPGMMNCLLTAFTVQYISSTEPAGEGGLAPFPTGEGSQPVTDSMSDRFQLENIER